MSSMRRVWSRSDPARPAQHAARRADAFVHLGLVVLGGLLWWWSDNWLLGIPVALVAVLVYDVWVSARVEQWVTRRQRAYDTTPDGRLTRDHR